MKKKTEFYNVIEKIFCIMFIAQLLTIIFINLTQMDKHLGYDASAYYLKAMECWKQKTLFCQNWVEQTTLFFDSPLPIAVLLYGILGNIFLAYGIANIITILGCIVVFLSIGKALQFERLSQVVCLNLYLCPYLTERFENANDLEYFSSTLTSNEGYGVKPIIVMMLILAMLQLNHQKTKRIYLAVVAGLCFVAGISSGYYILAVGVMPCILYLIIKALADNDLMKLRSRTTAFFVLCAGLIVSGKWIAVHIIGFEAKDSTMIWVGLIDFWKNLGSIFLGFMQVVSALPTNSDTEILLPASRTYLFSMIIFIIMMVAIIYFVRVAMMRKRDWDGILLGVVIGSQVILYSLLYTTYGSELFETRYLIAAYFIIIIMIGYMIQNLGREWQIKGLGLVVLLVSIGYIDIKSDQIYITNSIDQEQIQTVLEAIEKTDAKVVWYQGNSGRTFTRNLRIFDPDRVYKVVGSTGDLVHWGDYTYYDSNEMYTGSTILLAEEDQDFIPSHIMSQYDKVAVAGNMVVYKSPINPYDMVSGISSEEYSVDLPANFEIRSQGADMMEDGTLMTDGTEGFVMWNENCKARPGNYDFTINYECIAAPGEEGFAEFLVIEKNEVIGRQMLRKGFNSITIQNVEFDEDTESFAYYLSEIYGTVLKIHSIEIKSVK